jgi:hypothetical protein
MELATNRQAMSASSTPSGSAPPAKGAPTMMEKGDRRGGCHVGDGLEQHLTKPDRRARERLR